MIVIAQSGELENLEAGAEADSRTHGKGRRTYYVGAKDNSSGHNYDQWIDADAGCPARWADFDRIGRSRWSEPDPSNDQFSVDDSWRYRAALWHSRKREHWDKLARDRSRARQARIVVETCPRRLAFMTATCHAAITNGHSTFAMTTARLCRDRTDNISFSFKFRQQGPANGLETTRLRPEQRTYLITTGRPMRALCLLCSWHADVTPSEVRSPCIARPIASAFGFVSSCMPGHCLDFDTDASQTFAIAASSHPADAASVSPRPSPYPGCADRRTRCRG